MKITTGEWKTRCGLKAIAAAVNESAKASHQVIGWIGQHSQSWCIDGNWSSNGGEAGLDLIAPWTDPVPWDWSTTPPWINWIAKNAKGVWCMFDNEPSEMGNAWSLNGASCHHVPQSHAPKWDGDWKLSKTMRPKGVAK